MYIYVTKMLRKKKEIHNNTNYHKISKKKKYHSLKIDREF